jgi:hypothetical protein
VFDRFYAVLLIFSAFYGPKPLAADNLDTNFRERCRKTISGQYSNALADKALAEDAVALASEAIAKSKKQITSDETKLKALNQKIQSTEYAPDLLNERDLLTSQIKLYREQLATSEGQLASSQKLMTTSKKRIESIRKKVDAIFNVSMVPDPEGGSRKLLAKIEWKSPCPKYRVLCPLPEKDLKILKELRTEVDDSDLACERYTKIK